jgi:6-pyruvoyltetrahydropterin/6-carboxytetrahydropterin synthase
MTVFPDGSKERLHGHNFNVTVALDLRLYAFETLLDIGIVKAAVDAQCREWNEHLLLAEHNPYLQILRRDQELEFRLCGRRYVVPADEVVLLPIDNIIVETLSMEFARRVIERLRLVLKSDVVEGVEVDVREARGQGGSTYCPIDS